MNMFGMMWTLHFSSHILRPGLRHFLVHPHWLASLNTITHIIHCQWYVMRKFTGNKALFKLNALSRDWKSYPSAMWENPKGSWLVHWSVQTSLSITYVVWWAEPPRTVPVGHSESRRCVASPLCLMLETSAFQKARLQWQRRVQIQQKEAAF